MSMYMNMEPALGFSPTGFRVLPRANNKCDVGSLGSGGICVKESTCDGALFPTDCGQGYECCFLRGCDISEGSGNCKNETRDSCDGKFYPGPRNDPPCAGGNEMLCCVNFADMNNGTSSSTSVSSATASSTGTSSTSTNSSTSTDDDSDGLQGNEIGGIVGGVVGGVVVIAAAVLLWLWWRRKNKPSAAEEFTPVSTKPDKDGFSELPEYGSGGVPMHEIGEGNQRVEVDAHGPELHEMEGHSPIAELDGGDVRKPQH